MSDINVMPGELANLAAVELDRSNGAINAFSAASAVTMVIDVEGWIQ
ncbi:MAG: hypothetical protein ACYDCS_01065 [Candidatus Dormibacteria bacterium]